LSVPRTKRDSGRLRFLFSATWRAGEFTAKLCENCRLKFFPSLAAMRSTKASSSLAELSPKFGERGLTGTPARQRKTVMKRRQRMSEWMAVRTIMVFWHPWAIWSLCSYSDVSFLMWVVFISISVPRTRVALITPSPWSLGRCGLRVKQAENSGTAIRRRGQRFFFYF